MTRKAIFTILVFALRADATTQRDKGPQRTEQGNQQGQQIQHGLAAVMQALALTDVVIGAAVTGLLLALAVQVHKRAGTLDPDELRSTRD